MQNSKGHIKEVSSSHLLTLKLRLLCASYRKEVKQIETPLTCQYITALNQLEKQHSVSSVEMDFHLIRLFVLARGSRRVSQQSGLCASRTSLGTSQCSAGSPVVYVPGCERVVEDRG